MPHCANRHSPAQEPPMTDLITSRFDGLDASQALFRGPALAGALARAYEVIPALHPKLFRLGCGVFTEADALGYAEMLADMAADNGEPDLDAQTFLDLAEVVYRAERDQNSDVAATRVRLLRAMDAYRRAGRTELLTSASVADLGDGDLHREQRAGEFLDLTVGDAMMLKDPQNLFIPVVVQSRSARGVVFRVDAQALIDSLGDQQ